jgi:thioredoxin-like negative regulator of GroEL
MDQLLEIIRLDRSFRDDVGVKGMVSILNIIAADTEQVKQYRQKMIDAMS